MTQIILVAHAPMASALQAVAQHVYPDCGRQLQALDVESGASAEQVELRLRQLLDGQEAGEVLLLADVFGATPCNAALRVADGLRVRVVAGVNVPMLWRTLCYAAESLERLVSRATEGGAQGVMQVSAPRRQNQAPNVASHAQVHDSHQQ